MEGEQVKKIQELFDSEIEVINIGLERFNDALIAQEISTIHVKWRPPAGGKEELEKILDELNK